MSLPPQWCVMLVHRKGGSASRVRDTAADAERAGAVAMGENVNSYLCATHPYEVHESARYPGVYDTSIPAHVLARIGPEAVRMYGARE